MIRTGDIIGLTFMMDGVEYGINNSSITVTNDKNQELSNVSFNKIDTKFKGLMPLVINAMMKNRFYTDGMKISFLPHGEPITDNHTIFLETITSAGPYKKLLYSYFENINQLVFWSQGTHETPNFGLFCTTKNLIYGNETHLIARNGYIGVDREFLKLVPNDHTKFIFRPFKECYCIYEDRCNSWPITSSSLATIKCNEEGESCNLGDSYNIFFKLKDCIKHLNNK